MTQAIETTTIEQYVRIAASAETLWEFWTQPDRLAEWWGTSAEAVAEPGGIFRVVMDSGPIMRGEYLELDAPNRLVFSFGWESNASGELMAPGTTRVEITLTPDGDETLLVLRHLDIPATHAPDHAQGWSHFIIDCLSPAASAA